MRFNRNCTRWRASVRKRSVQESISTRCGTSKISSISSRLICNRGNDSTCGCNSRLWRSGAICAMRISCPVGSLADAKTVARAGEVGPAGPDNRLAENPRLAKAHIRRVCRYQLLVVHIMRKPNLLEVLLGEAGRYLGWPQQALPSWSNLLTQVCPTIECNSWNSPWEVMTVKDSGQWPPIHLPMEKLRIESFLRVSTCHHFKALQKAPADP